MKRALITGITGQDGSFLAEFLHAKGYEVFGLVRRTSTVNTSRLNAMACGKELKLYFGDMTDTAGLFSLMQEIQPDEVYNLAAMSHVGLSFVQPIYTGEVDALGVIRLLEAI